MATYLQTRFDGGLNVVSPPGLLDPGQAYYMENWTFGRVGIRRRGGRSAAYSRNQAAAVTMLRRYHDIRTSGTISSYFLVASANDVFKGNADWDDLSPTAGGIAKTAFVLPTWGGGATKTLAQGASKDPLTIDNGKIVDCVVMQSRAYIVVHSDSGDDADDLENVALRCDGTDLFVHGLYPGDFGGTPLTLVGAPGTAIANGVTAWYTLTCVYEDFALGESGPGVVQSINNASGSTKDVDVSILEPTKDVTAVRVWRSEDSAAGPFYLVGEVATASLPGTLTDTLPSLNLEAQRRLDQDIYLPPKYRCATVWKNRLVIANTKARDTSDATTLDSEAGGVHKGRIRFSVPYWPDAFRALEFSEPIPDGSSGEIKAVIVNPQLDILLAIYEDDVMALEGDSPLGTFGTPFIARNIANSRGTASPFSVLEWQGFVFYWTKTGIEVISGYTARNITDDTIAPLWNLRDETAINYEFRINSTRLSQVRGIIDPRTEKAYWTYPSGTSTYNDRILELDLRRWRQGGYRDGVFAIHSGITTGPMEVWLGEGDRAELFGGESQSHDWVYRMDFANEDENGLTTLATAPISATLKLGITDMGRPDQEKSFKNLTVEGRSGDTSVRVGINVDDGALVKVLGDLDFEKVDFEWGTSVWGTGIWNGPRIVSHTIAIPREANGTRIGVDLTILDALDSSTNGPTAMELYDMAISFSPLRDRVTR